MNMKANMNNLMKKAQEMQSKMQAAQKELENMLVVGEAGGGLVKVHVTGRHDVKKVELDDNVLRDDKDILEDLIAAAMNDANRKIERETTSRMSSLTSGLKMPEGFSSPFDGE